MAVAFDEPAALEPIELELTVTHPPPEGFLSVTCKTFLTDDFLSRNEKLKKEKKIRNLMEWFPLFRSLRLL